MKTSPRSSRAIAMCLGALVLLTAADLWSKSWAEQRLSQPTQRQASGACAPNENGHYFMQRNRTDSIVLIEGYLELRYAENCGAAFGLLDRAPRWLRASVFLVSGSVAIGALLFMFVRGSGGRLFAWSVPLVVSGAIGNMVDRVRLGYVVDFIYFHIHQSFEWPTFNIADATITVGVVLLLLDGMRRPDHAATSPGAHGQSASAEGA